MNDIDPSLPADPWNRDDERSLINIVPNAVQSSILRAYERRSDLASLDERSLLKKLRSEHKEPTPTDNRLRIAFWQAYDKAQHENKNIVMDSVHAGICTKPYFYSEYLERPEKVAWMMCIPSSYEKYLDEALHYGLQQLRDILDEPHTYIDEETGKSLGINIKLATLKAKIVAMLDVRKHGAPTQKIEQKSMNLNVSTSNEKVAEIAMLNSMEEIEERLKVLRKQDAKMIDVEVINDE